MTTPPAWLELDRTHVWHPYTQHGLSAPVRPIVRASGAYLHDANGQRYLDTISSWWVTLHGHAHPAIAEAVAEQARTLEQVIFAGFAHEPASRLAAELVARLPEGLSRVFYSDNGSTAVEVALKMVLQLWWNRGEPRKLIVALDNAYHGDTFGAMSASGSGLFTSPFANHLFEIVRLPDPTEGDTVAALQRLLDQRGREIAGMIVEPLLMGATGMRIWSSDMLGAIRAATRAHGIPLIADEVLTGFGRTGPLFASAEIGPDLICLSKGLTGGFLPLGVTAVREEIFEAFRSTDRHKTFFHGHSFTANPVACAAARASLALLDDDCAERRRMIETAHRSGLDRLASAPGVSRPRILGTAAAFDLEGGGNYLDPIGARLSSFAFEAGVFLRPLGNVVYLLPPYCITRAELEYAYETIAQFLSTAY